jgi:hypothetical protein
VENWEKIEILHLKANSQNIESWIAIDENYQTIGHIFMSIENENKIKFLDAWVDEKHRRKGVFRMLWDSRWNYVLENFRGHKVYAWCKENSLPLLLEKGFFSGETVVYVEKNIN